MNNNYSSQIIQCLKNVGLFIDNKDEASDLSDFFADSLNFIMFIVELEQMFHVEIPDKYLLVENLLSIDSVNSMIDELKKVQENDKGLVGSV